MYSTQHPVSLAQVMVQILWKPHWETRKIDEYGEDAIHMVGVFMPFLQRGNLKFLVWFVLSNNLVAILHLGIKFTARSIKGVLIDSGG